VPYIAPITAELKRAAGMGAPEHLPLPHRIVASLIFAFGLERSKFAYTIVNTVILAHFDEDVIRAFGRRIGQHEDLI
jgi:hypothetical protein